MKANPFGALNLGSQIRSILLGAAVASTAALAIAPLAQAQDDEMARHQAEHVGNIAVKGGKQPLVGAAITLYAASSAGYGSAATVIATGTTNAKGQIVYKTFKKPSGNPQTYLVALGGNAGAGVNSAIGLSAALGPYDSIPGSYAVDEITTVASVYALSQFLNFDGTQLGTSATNATGLNDAVSTTKNLAVLKTGLAATALVSGAFGTPPTATLNTLGDVLDAANSAAPGSPIILSLFADATPPGGGAVPTTTLQAALDIARNPTNNASAIFALASGDTTYTPVLAAAPNDWTLGIDFTGGTVLGANTKVSGIGVDAAGKVWFSAYGSDPTVNAGNGFIANITKTGVPSAVYTDNGNVSYPLSLVIDSSGKVFVPNFLTGTVTGLANSGKSIKGSPFGTLGLLTPSAITVDASGHVVVAADNHVTELTPPSYTATALAVPATPHFLQCFGPVGVNGSGTVFAVDGCNGALDQLPNTAYPDPNFTAPIGFSFDFAGNAWVGNSGLGVAEFVAANGYTSVDYVNDASTVGGLAVDSAGKVWVGGQDSNGNNGVVELSNSGVELGDLISLGGALANANSVDNVALDASGNLWIAGDSNHIIEVVGVASPVKTPVVEVPTKP